MSVAHRWGKLKPPTRCGCGELATTSLMLLNDANSAGTQYLCDACALAKKVELNIKPRPRKHGKHLHGDYGRANSDTRSVMQSSIRNWGNKIKARTKTA